MLKYRFVLVIVSVVVVAILFSLPKVVVKNKEEATTEQADVDTLHSETDGMHAQSLPEGVQGKLGDFRSRYQNAEGKDKGVWLDSLIVSYQKATMPDSAAFYAEQFSEQYPDARSWQKAGEMFYEAFTFAIDETKQAKMSEKARFYFQKVLELEPNNLKVKNKLAMTWVSSPTPMTGILMLREVLDKDPKNEDALYNLGVLAMQTGQFNKAAERFEKLIAINAENVQARFYLGVCYAETKEKKKAREQFEWAKKLSTDPAVISAVDEYLNKLK